MRSEGGSRHGGDRQRIDGDGTRAQVEETEKGQ